MEIFRRYIPTELPTEKFHRYIPTNFETELFPSVYITDGTIPSVIPLVFSGFLVVGTPGTSLWKEYICKKYTLIFTNGVPTFSQRLSGSVVWYNIFLATC